MKKLFFVPLALAIIASSCHKIKDYWQEHHEPQSYRLVKLELPLIFPFKPNTGVFTYNNHNDPVSVMFDPTSFPDSEFNFRFEYDNQHRLKEYIWFIGPIATPLDNRRYIYFYNNQGQIISDSFYFNEEYSEWKFVYTGHYTYDSQGRIIKVTDKIGDSIVQEHNYVYDANGNLERESYVYDNKVHFLRTHKVWQFISRDYSKNNPYYFGYKDLNFVPIHYNHAGLPVAFNFDPGAYAPLIFLNKSYQLSHLTYEKY